MKLIPQGMNQLTWIITFISFSFLDIVDSIIKCILTYSIIYHVITFRLSGSKLSWYSTGWVTGSIPSVGILDGYDGQVWQVVLSGSLTHSWVTSINTDHTFPCKLEHTDREPAQTVWRVLVSRGLCQHHQYTCKPEYILERQKRKVSLCLHNTTSHYSFTSVIFHYTLNLTMYHLYTSSRHCHQYIMQTHLAQTKIKWKKDRDTRDFNDITCSSSTISWWQSLSYFQYPQLTFHSLYIRTKHFYGDKLSGHDLKLYICF